MHFYWRINRERAGYVSAFTDKNFASPDAAIEAAKEYKQTSTTDALFISMYSSSVSASGNIGMSTWVSDLDLKGRPLKADLSLKHDIARGLKNNANMHLVKYIKEHYEHSGNLQLDLAHIMLAWCGLSMEPEDVSLNMIFMHVNQTWSTIVPEHKRDLYDLLRDHFTWGPDKESIEIIKLIRLMLESMRWLAADELPEFPAGDPDILPLDAVQTEAGWNKSTKEREHDKQLQQ